MDFFKKKMNIVKKRKLERGNNKKNIFKYLCEDVQVYIFCFLECKLQKELILFILSRSYLKFGSNILLSDFTNNPNNLNCFSKNINYVFFNTYISNINNHKIYNVEFDNIKYYNLLMKEYKIPFINVKITDGFAKNITIKCKNRLILEGCKKFKVDCRILILKKYIFSLSTNNLPKFNNLKKLHLINCDTKILKEIVRGEIKEVVIEDPIDKNPVIYDFCNMKTLKLINCGEFTLNENIKVSNLYLINSFYTIKQQKIENKNIKVYKTFMLNNIDFNLYGYQKLSYLYEKKNNVKYLILENIKKEILYDLLQLCINCMRDLIEIKIFVKYKVKPINLISLIPDKIRLIYWKISKKKKFCMIYYNRVINHSEEFENICKTLGTV